MRITIIIVLAITLIVVCLFSMSEDKKQLQVMKSYQQTILKQANLINKLEQQKTWVPGVCVECLKP